jgi:ectoine hydroxylase-related dioxygenase (phytanoyl-CoA dioxygenase family)
MRHPEISIYNDLSSDTVKIKPEEGKLLIFPSYIHHAVEENLSDQDRVVISFNIDIK